MSLLQGYCPLFAPYLALPSTVLTEEKMNYKIITMKDRFFSGKFDPEKLETMLNSYAGEGWELSGVTTAEIPGALGQKREEIIFILERP